MSYYLAFSQAQPTDAANFLGAGGPGVNTCGLHRAVSQQIGQLHNIAVGIHINPGEEVAQIMEKRPLLRYASDTGRFLQVPPN